MMVAGCATVPPPVQQLAVSRAAVEQARAGGAVEYAPSDYSLAVQRLQDAETLYRDGRYMEAGPVAEEAEVDARTALARANAQRSQQAQAEIERGLQALRAETARAPQ
jgi:hypothetical protein